MDEPMNDAEQYEPGPLVDRVGAQTRDGLAKIFGDLSADKVFGIEQVGDRLVITAAAIERAGGFGFGAGAGSDADQPDAAGGGGGGGGGGSGQARPVAIIEVTADGVSVRPVLDYTKIGITVLMSFLAAWKLIRRI
jgi:uncharacterized spore protein YtfJ